MAGEGVVVVEVWKVNQWWWKLRKKCNVYKGRLSWAHTTPDKTRMKAMERRDSKHEEK